jgi:glucose-6-phosphate dehydrogenase assembly protein OpcA
MKQVVEQAATVTFTYAATTPAATVQGWTATMYVNNTPIVLTDTCVLTTTVTPNVNTCTATVPMTAINPALTTTGPQTFEGTLADGILESARSVPFVLTRPSAPSALGLR